MRPGRPFPLGPGTHKRGKTHRLNTIRIRPGCRVRAAPGHAVWSPRRGSQKKKPPALKRHPVAAAATTYHVWRTACVALVSIGSLEVRSCPRFSAWAQTEANRRPQPGAVTSASSCQGRALEGAGYRLRDGQLKPHSIPAADLAGVGASTARGFSSNRRKRRFQEDRGVITSNGAGEEIPQLKPSSREAEKTNGPHAEVSTVDSRSEARPALRRALPCGPGHIRGPVMGFTVDLPWRAWVLLLIAIAVPVQCALAKFTASLPGTS